MLIKVITNNPKVKEYSIAEDFDTILLNCCSKNVLRYSRNLIMCGWKLAADPLAGYISRYNPFHTVFLQKNDIEDIAAKDILRLERMVNHLDNPKRPKNIDNRTRQDYCYLDYSIATSTMMGLFKNLKYFTIE